MKALIHSLTRFCLARPLLTVLAAAIIVLTGASGLARLGFDNRPDAFFLEGDTSVERWRAFKDQYASDEFSFILLNPERSDAAFLTNLRQLTDELTALDEVERVTSIVNVRSIRDEDGFLDVGDYIPAELPAEQALERLKQAPSHPYYGGLFASRDGAHYGIVVETGPDLSTEQKGALTDAIRALIHEPRYAAMQARAVGAPILDTDVQRIVGAESGTFGAITMALVLAGFVLAFRSWIGFVLPVSVALGAILVTLGGMGHFGVPAGLLTPIIPSFLISVGLGSAVYLLSEYHMLRRAGTENRTAIFQTMEEAGLPAILANVTTAGALFAFSGSKVLPVQHVGLALGGGLLVALLLTLLLFPVLAQWLGGRIRPRHANRAQAESRLLARICAFALRRPKTILGSFAALVLLALIGMLQLKTDYYYLGTFKDSTAIVQDYEATNASIPVTNSIEFVVRASGTAPFHDPAALRALDEIAALARDAAGDLPIKSYGLPDIVREIAGQTMEQAVIPDDRAAIAQLLLLFEGSGHDELSRVTTPAYDEARITFLVPARPYSGYDPVLKVLTDEAPGILSRAGLQQAETEVTGVVPLWMRLSSFLTQTQITSFLAAAAVVTLVMVLLFRSLTLGLGMAVANIGCVVIVLGAMGWLGIMLDPFTILIGAIALGILDDDTIHFTTSALLRMKEGASARAAIATTYQGAGRAMGLQTLVLVTAFLVYGFSSVASLTLFGLLTTCTIIVGLAAEYLVTPALILVLSSRSMPEETAPSPKVPT